MFVTYFFLSFFLFVTNRKTLLWQVEESVADVSMGRVTTLHQEDWETKILNSMLVIIVLLAIVLYTHYSINPFSEEEIAQMQGEKLREIHNRSLWEESSAISP